MLSPTFTVNIAEGCNGIYALFIFMAGIIAYPSSIRHKLYGLAIGIPFIMLLNYIRIISLWYAGTYAPNLFKVMHLYIWETIIIALGGILWLFWYEKWVKKP